MTSGTSLSLFHWLILNSKKKKAIYLGVYGKIQHDENPKLRHKEETEMQKSHP
jgi:hypothetical protein